MKGPGSSSDSELEIANLAAREMQSSAALYSLNYTNIPVGEKFTGISLASGRVLSSRDGRFKFEQTSSDPTKSYLIHYDPTGNLLIVFPGLKTAFKAPAEILQAPEVLPLLAAYDGLRILMGQGDIWSDPDRTQFKTRRSGGATVEQMGRPFRWNITFEPSDLLFPIKEMDANSGSKKVLNIGRETLSYESLDYSSGGPGGIPGQDVRGSQVNINTWKFVFPRAPSTTEIQIQPITGQDAEQLVGQGGLNAPEIPSNFQVEAIAPITLMNRLNIR